MSSPRPRKRKSAAFERNTEPTDLTVAQVLTDFVPLSKLMAEPIAALRQWSLGRARPAATPPAERKPGLMHKEPRRKARLFFRYRVLTLESSIAP